MGHSFRALMGPNSNHGLLASTLWLTCISTWPRSIRIKSKARAQIKVLDDSRIPEGATFGPHSANSSWLQSRARTLHHDPQICEVANNSKDSSVSKNQSVSPATSSSKQTCPAREDIEHVSQTISIRPPTWWKARCWHQS